MLTDIIEISALNFFLNVIEDFGVKRGNVVFYIFSGGSRTVLNIQWLFHVGPLLIYLFLLP
jgi:hypothetical protein